MKGELIKGLLPQSSVRADYTVHRVQGESFIILSGKVNYRDFSRLMLFRPIVIK